MDKINEILNLYTTQLKRGIKKISIHIDYFFTYQRAYVKYVYILSTSIIVIGIIAYLIGFDKQQHVVKTKDNEIISLLYETDALDSLLGLYEDDIRIYNDFINDKDFMRYIAFKYSNIEIPNYVPVEDIKIINRFSKHYDIPQEYIWRLIYKESRYNPKAKSHMGASGYMQIMPATYRALYNSYTKNEGSLDAYNDQQKNLILGIYYLRRLHNKYNDWALAFAAYNAGPGNVDKAGKKVPNFKETKDYVNFIKKDKK